MDKYGSYLHGVDFGDGQQSAGFAFNVLLGALLDRGREQLVEKWGEGLAEQAAHASRPATQAALRCAG